MNRSQFLRILLLTLTTAGTLHAVDKKPKATIGVSLLTLTHPFFRDLGEALRAEAAKNGMEVVLTAGDYTALGAVAAVEKAGNAGQVAIVGFDGSPEGRRAIRDGKIYADPIQFPDRIGTQAVQSIVKYLAGDDVPTQILIPTALYKKADAAKDASLK